jgi:hypothetical protein
MTKPNNFRGIVDVAEQVLLQLPKFLDVLCNNPYVTVASKVLQVNSLFV